MEDLSFLPDQPKPDQAGVQPQALPPMAQAPADPGDFSDLPDQPSDLDQLYKKSLAIDPAQAAKVDQMAKRLAEPEQFVEKNLESLQQLAQAPDSGFWKQYEAQYPESAKFLKKNMAFARDDFDQMGTFESYATQISSGLKKGNLEAKLAELHADRLAETRDTGVFSQKHQAEIGSIEKELEPLRALDAKVGKNFHPLYQAAGQAPNMSRAFVKFGAGDESLTAGPAALRAIEGAGTGAAVGAAVGAVAGGVGAVPGATTGAGIGARVGSVAGMAQFAYQMEAGNAFKEYSDLKDKDGNPISPKAAADAAHVVGLVNAGLETAGELLLLKLAAPLGKSLGLVGGKAAEQIAKAPGGSRIISLINGNPKVFTGMTLGAAVKEAGKLMAEGIGGEVTTEYLQEISSGVGGEAAKSLSGQTFNENKGIVQIAGESTGVIYPTFQATLLLGAGGGGAHIYNSVHEMKQAEQAKAAYLELGKQAEKSKLREIKPEAHEEFVAGVTKDSPIQNVYISPQAMETYFQGKKVSARQAAEELGVGSQFDAAKETGQVISVPLSTWTSKVVGTEHHAGLANDVKFSPEALSVNEAKERETLVKDQLDAEFKKSEAAIAEDATRKAGHDMVEQSIKDALVAAKPREMLPAAEKDWTRQVDVAAKVWASRAVTEATRRGQTVEEYFNTIRPTILNESAQQARIAELPVPKTTEMKPEILQAIRQEIEGGELVQGNVTKDQEGYVTGRFGRYSTYPEWFKNKGYTKAETLSAIDKHLAGGELSERQTQILQDLYSGSGYDPRFQGKEVSEPFLQSAAPARAVFIGYQEDGKGGHFALYNVEGDSKIGRSTVTERDLKEAGIAVPEIPSVEEWQKDPAAFRKPLFQDEESPRGQIQFGAEGPIIQLFRGADASTFLHESAHLWLKDTFDYVRAHREGLPEAYQKDWKVLSEWLGVTEDQAELTVDQQEQFARGFEAYLREGQAPSEGLRKVFRSLRMWLTRVYRDVKALRVEITPEVKGVMDRMLATDAEIEAARVKVGYTPLQGSVTDLDPAQVKKLQRLQERAHEEAVSVLLKRQMDELKAGRKEFLAERRKELTKEYRARIGDEPIYRVQEDLKARVGSSKSGKVLSRQYLNGELEEERQALFDTQAELAGFSSGDELAKAILAADPMETRVAQGVGTEMSAYADLKDTTQIREEALKAIHNERSLELMSLENEILNQLVKGAEITDEAKSRRSQEAKIEAQAIKTRAHELMWKLNTRAATAFGPLFTAERRAAESAARAMAAKEFDRAATLKRQQMLNHSLAIESLKIKDKVAKWQSFLRDLQTKDMTGFRKEEHFNQVAAILSRIGIQRRDFDPAKRRETLAQWTERMNEMTNTVNMPDWILDESKIKPMDELTINELQDVVNGLKNIVRVASFENRAMTISKGATFEEIKSKLRMEMKLGRKGRKPQHLKMEPSKWDQIKSFTAKYLLSITKVQTMLRSIQGWNDQGEWTSTFWEPVYRAANDESSLMAWASDGLKKSFEIYSEKERADLVEKQTFYPELNTSVTKMKLIMMALNLGNEDNRQKLFDNKPVGVEEALAWDEGVVMGLLQKNLTQKDWDFVQATWDLINERWPDIAALHKELTGFAPGKVEASPFNVQLQDGSMILLKGGYFPLKEDPRASVRASEREELDSPLYTEKNPGWKAATKTGHTKARTGAQYSVSLDHSLIYRHLRDVIHDLAFRKTVIDLRRLIQDEEVHGMLQESVGLEGYAMLREWVASVAAGNTQVLSPLERIVSELRRRSTVAALMLRVGVITQNFANPFLFPGTVDGFGWKESMHGYWMRGVFGYWTKALTDRKGYREMQDFVFQNSRFMADKHTNPDLSIMDVHAKAFGQDSKIQEFATGLMSGSDELTSIPMWLEAYNLGLDRKNMEHEEAVLYADSLIDRTLGSGRKYDAAAIQRAGELSKVLSMFYSFLNTEYNRWASEVGQVQVDAKSLPQFLGFVASRLILFQGASLLLSGKGPGGDDDKLKWLFKQAVAYPLNFFPGFREVGNVALDEALGFKTFGYRPSPASSAIEASLRTVKAAGQYARGDVELESLLESMSKTASYVVPYPDQFNAWFWNAHDTMFNGMKPKPADLMQRRPRNDR